MNGDRMIHASMETNGSTAVVVRYNRSGKWYLERDARALIPRRALKLHEAVEVAISWLDSGGLIHFDRPGGRQFDRRVRAILSAETVHPPS